MSSWQDGGMPAADSTLGAGRYAPSPSGDLHIGNLRTALISWLAARTTGRSFYIRIEDLDRARDSGAAASQLEDLQRIGIDWDGEPVVQSTRGLIYESAIERLQSLGLVYECTCSRRDIHSAASAPHAAPGAYPGTCRELSEKARELARERIFPRQPALRLKVPAGRREEPNSGGPITHRSTVFDAASFGLELTSGPEVSFSDRVLGSAVGTVDDFVLQRGDGTMAYNLAVVVDDETMSIDQVVRGDDLASSTPRQIVLQQLLGYSRPEYAHVPLVLGPTGARLAKRDGAVTLRDLASTGVNAAEVLTQIAVSLRLAVPGERVTSDMLLERFSFLRLPSAPWIWRESDVSASARE